MRFDLVGAIDGTLTIACSSPASTNRSSIWSISALPPTGIRGFGIVSVTGRMRVPSPAAKTMAVRGIGATGCTTA